MDTPWYKWNPIRKNQKTTNSWFLAYAGAKTLPAYHAEALRFSLYPLYDAWVSTMVQAGDSMISSYCYANASFKKVKRLGGTTYLDGGNSHPDNFWEILIEEHSRWKSPYPPVPHFYIKRARETVNLSDYILSPSQFVSDSFLNRGFTEEQIIPVVYPQDLDLFKPRKSPRNPNQPLTIISTGSLSLRKGTPYLLEAYRLILQEIPNARLLLTNAKTSSILAILEKHRDLPIEWSPSLPHQLLAERLRSADLFILPSLEEGLVRTALEAMACGLPVILTPNTGTSQYVQEGYNGSIVPIRDAHAIAHSAIAWWKLIKEGYQVDVSNVTTKLTMETLKKCISPLLSNS